MAALNGTEFQKCRGNTGESRGSLENPLTIASSCHPALLNHHLTLPQLGEAADPEVGVLDDFPGVAERSSAAAPDIPAPSLVRSLCSKHKSTLRLRMPLLLEVDSLGLTVFLTILIT